MKNRKAGPSCQPEGTDLRKRVFEIIEKAEKDDTASAVYDVIMMITILASLVPLAFTEEYPAFRTIGIVTSAIFLVDYVLRLWTADYLLQKGAASFLLYPFTPMALIDLISILTSLPAVSNSFRMLRVFRLIRTLRVFKALRYSATVRLFSKVFRAEKEAFAMVGAIAVGYILLAALVILNLEPENFGNYLNAVYWAALTLTTVGFGDFAPVTDLGKLVTIVTSLMGTAIVAMPVGIIVSGLLREVGKQTDDDPTNDTAPYTKKEDRFS